MHVAAAERPSEEERRRQRASWPVRQFRLGDEPGDDLSTTTTVAERLAMMSALAQDAFYSTRPEPPGLPRALWPIAIRQLGEAEID